MVSEDAIISFTIKINAELSEESKNTLNNLQDAKSKEASTTQEQQIEDNPKDTIEQQLQKKLDKNIKESQQKTDTQKSDKELKDDVVKTLNKLDSKGLQTLSNFATNPTGSALSALTSAITSIGPEGAALVSIIGIALAAPTVITKIVQALSVKGGPLNRDYLTNLVTKQVEVGISRSQQIRLQQGEDQVILSQQAGFTQNNSQWSYNSYLKINDTRLARIGLTDRAAGFVTP